MTQSINKSILCIAVHVAISFHLQASSILKYDGLNFFEWCEQIQFHLGVLDLDLDLALLNDRLAATMNSSSTKHKAIYKAWERSNRLSLVFMRMTIANIIKATIPNTKSVREYMKLVKERSQSESID